MFSRNVRRAAAAGILGALAGCGAGTVDAGGAPAAGASAAATPTARELRRQAATEAKAALRTAADAMSKARFGTYTTRTTTESGTFLRHRRAEGRYGLRSGSWSYDLNQWGSGEPVQLHVDGDKRGLRWNVRNGDGPPDEQEFMAWEPYAAEDVSGLAVLRAMKGVSVADAAGGKKIIRGTIDALTALGQLALWRDAVDRGADALDLAGTAKVSVTVDRHGAPTFLEIDGGDVAFRVADGVPARIRRLVAGSTFAQTLTLDGVDKEMQA